MIVEHTVQRTILYGAKAMARVHPFHLMNADYVSTEWPLTDLGRESADNWQLLSASTIVIYY